MNFERFLKYLVNGLIGISTILLFVSLVEAFSREFVLTYEGVINFFSIFLAFKEIFSATIILITVFYSIKTFTEGRAQKEKDFWISTFKERLKELRQDNSIIYSRCLLDISPLFEYAFNNNFLFRDEDQLKDFLDRFVKPWIDSFEMRGSGYEEFQGVYPNAEHSYSSATYFEALLHICQPSPEFRDTFLDRY
jgi:hypothetical protein